MSPGRWASPLQTGGRGKRVARKRNISDIYANDLIPHVAPLDLQLDQQPLQQEVLEEVSIHRRSLRDRDML